MVCRYLTRSKCAGKPFRQTVGRARAARPDLPILFLNGYADSAAMDAALDGRALVLTKPVECRALFDAIAIATTNEASG